MNTHTELLIIGAGPAGMAAALAAASTGMEVILLDDNIHTGGQIWRDGPRAHLPKAARSLRRKLEACRNIRRYSGSRVVAITDHQTLLIEDAERAWKISYDKLILCSGARELLLPFPGWTLPGVTGAGALQALVKGGLGIERARVVIAGSGPLLLASAATASKAGGQVLGIYEQATLASIGAFALHLPRWPSKLLQSFSLFSTAYRTDSHVIEALGDKRLEAVRVQSKGKVMEIECDRLACGFGLSPNIDFARALGYTIDKGAIEVDDVQASSLTNHYAAGECTGIGGSELALITGSIAGFAAAGDTASARQLWSRRERWKAFADAVDRAFKLDPKIKTLANADTLICRCEDVSYGAISGYDNWHSSKLGTRCGMGACQGRVCGSALKYLLDWQPGVLRPPFSPARIETLEYLEETPS